MVELYDALVDPNFPFLRNAIIVGLLASVAFGLLGSYVVARRMTYMADAIAHCVLGGVGAAAFLRYNLDQPWSHPMAGAIAAALVAALGIGLVSLYAREREDTVISVVWVAGVAIGLLLLDRSTPPPGEPAIDPMSYLFGDINLISTGDIMIVAWLDAVIVGFGLLFRHKLTATCFDEEFTRLRGVNTTFYYLLLLCLTALTVVLLVRVVGILMVVALMALPAAIAARFAQRLGQMMALAIVFSAVFITAGLGLSYIYELRTGPTIIVLATAAYLAVAGLGALARR